jgi:hypothetical protein
MPELHGDVFVPRYVPFGVYLNGSVARPRRPFSFGRGVIASLKASLSESLADLTDLSAVSAADKGGGCLCVTNETNAAQHSSQRLMCCQSG